MADDGTTGGPEPGSSEETLRLAAAVRGSDETAALEAVEALASRPPVQAFTFLWEAVASASQSVREAIVGALNRIDAEALALLGRRALDSSSASDRLIGIAVVSVSEGRPAPLLAASLDDPSEDVRTAALRALLGRRDRSVLDTVGERMTDPLPHIRGLAVEVLARSNDDRALPFLLEGARDPDVQVRDTAREALLGWRSPVLVDLLLQGLESPTHRRASSELLIALGDRAWERMISELASAGPPTRRAIGDVLNAAGARERLVQDLEARGPDARRRAVEALGAMRAGDAVGELVLRLQDPAAGVRAKTAQALGDIGGEAALAALRHAMVSDPDMEVVSAIEHALRKLSGEAPNL